MTNVLCGVAGSRVVESRHQFQEELVVVLRGHAADHSADEEALKSIDRSEAVLLRDDVLRLGEEPEQHRRCRAGVDDPPAVEERPDAARRIDVREVSVRRTDFPDLSDNVCDRLPFVLNMELELGKHLVRLHLLGGLHDEPVVEEYVQAGSNDPPLPYLVAPPGILERLPVLPVELVGIQAARRCGLQNKVLDQIRRQQGSSSSIERLENHEGVVDARQVNYYNLKQAEQCCFERVDPLGAFLASECCFDPLSDLKAEEIVCLDYERVFMAFGRGHRSASPPETAPGRGWSARA